mmetsp:Transcript_29100/g.69313  ORF Transcript_29100/g.69313 Transcript_29100/m.69313 type:complete len:240 (+) Transcript_29100:1650-2369(+)
MRRRVLLERQGVDVVDRQVLDSRQAAMNNKDLLVNDRGQRQGLEGIDEVAIHRQTILLHHLILKAAPVVSMKSIHVLVLVVATVDDDRLWIRQKKREDDEQNLHPLTSTVDHVTIEEIPVFGIGRAQVVENVKYISQLPVRVANNYKPPVWLRNFCIHNGLGVPSLVCFHELVKDKHDVLLMKGTVGPVQEEVIKQSLCARKCHWPLDPVSNVIFRNSKFIAATLGSCLSPRSRPPSVL